MKPCKKHCVHEEVCAYKNHFKALDGQKPRTPLSVFSP